MLTRNKPYSFGRVSTPIHRSQSVRVRRSQNPTWSPRIERVPALSPSRFPPRTWEAYHGYPRLLRPESLPVTVPESLSVPPEPAVSLPRRQILTRLVFCSLPALLYPLFPRWVSLVYPRGQFLRAASRIPRSPGFFFEMLAVILSVATVVLIQTVFALIFFRQGKPGRSRPAVRWGEASVAGGLLAAGVYGVLRGFYYRPDDFFFLPTFALGVAVFFWLLVAGTALFSPGKAKAFSTPGPIRTADTRFRKPVLYPTELQGQKF